MGREEIGQENSEPRKEWTVEVGGKSVFCAEMDGEIHLWLPGHIPPEECGEKIRSVLSRTQINLDNARWYFAGHTYGWEEEPQTHLVLKNAS